MDVHYKENIRYTGFVPYREENLTTKKINHNNIYKKEFFNDISYKQSRQIPYFEKEQRWSTNYNSNIINSLDNIKKEDYSKPKLSSLSKI